MERPTAPDGQFDAVGATENTEQADIGAVHLGTVLDGKYEITAHIASGGMGSIYRARHIELGNDVAIKVLHPRYAADVEGMRRFQREARIISGLRHPNILSVYSFGSINGLVYMSMELIAGISLGQLIADNGPLSLDQAMPLLQQICDAMAFAHQNDVFHRDLKPDNVIVSFQPDGARSAKLIDFGLAKLLDGAEGQRLTKTGELLGDPFYMSPEQAQGQKLDHRSDIYSFGCLMYEVFTGAPPFTAEEAVAVLFKQVSEQPAPFAQRCNLPPSLEAIAFTALAKDADKRYDSFDAVKDVLQQVAANPAVKLKAPGFSRSTQSRPARRALIAGALVLAGAASALLMMTAPHLGFDNRQVATEQKRAEQEEQLRAFVRDTNNKFYYDKMNVDELQQTADLAQQLGNRSALSRAKFLQSNLYASELNREKALEASLEALNVGALDQYQRHYSQQNAAELARRIKRLPLAEKLFQNLYSEQMGPDSARLGHGRDDYGIDLADVKADLGKNAEALKLADERADEYQHVTTNPTKYPRLIGLADVYMKLGKFDRAKAMLDHLDFSWTVRNDKVNPSASAKLRLLCLQGDFAQLDQYKQKVLAQCFDDSTKLLVLSAISYDLCRAKHFDRAEKIQQEMSKIISPSEGERRVSNDAILTLTKMQTNEKRGDYEAVAREGESLLARLLASPAQSFGVIACKPIYSNALEHLGRASELEAIDKRVKSYLKQHGYPSGRTARSPMER